MIRFVGGRPYCLPMDDTPHASDDGRRAIDRIARTMLMEIDVPDTRPVLVLLYNIMPDPPDLPTYLVAPTDAEMWDSTPTVRIALDLLTQVTLLAPLRWPAGSRPAPLAHLRVDARPDRRLDGIALLMRAWSLDSTTTAGRAVLANVSEGFYEVGDVAASPHRRDIRAVNAVDRDGVRVALARKPDGSAEEIISSVGASAAAMYVDGTIPDGLALLLAALQSRFCSRVKP